MQDPLVGLTVVVVLAVGCMVLAARLRIPAIVPLLIAGILAGPSVADLVDPNELLGDLLSPFVSLAVGVILFEGALGLRREELEADTPPVVVRLLMLGALITWAVGFGGAVVLLDLPVGIALLVGAILIVSGPTVVLPLLEFVRPKPAVGRVLRWEGILIDPVGAIVAALVFAGLSSSGGFEPGGFLLSVSVGVAIGGAGGAVLWLMLRRGTMSSQLASVATLGVVVGVTGAADLVRDDAGLVAAIVAGLVMANQRTVPLTTILEFKETLGLLLVGLLFILLSALVVPSQVVDLGLAGLGFVALLVLVARPLGVLAVRARVVADLARARARGVDGAARDHRRLHGLDLQPQAGLRPRRRRREDRAGGVPRHRVHGGPVRVHCPTAGAGVGRVGRVGAAWRSVAGRVVFGSALERQRRGWVTGAGAVFPSDWSFVPL